MMEDTRACEVCGMDMERVRAADVEVIGPEDAERYWTRPVENGLFDILPNLGPEELVWRCPRCGKLAYVQELPLLRGDCGAENPNIIKIMEELWRT